MRGRFRFALHVANEETIPAVLTVGHAGQDDLPEGDPRRCQDIDVIDGIKGIETGLRGLIPDVIPCCFTIAIAAGGSKECTQTAGDRRACRENVGSVRYRGRAGLTDAHVPRAGGTAVDTIFHIVGDVRILHGQVGMRLYDPIAVINRQGKVFR